MAAIRAWFAERGFVEVDPSPLQVSPGNETHLHGFTVAATDAGGRRAHRYLHTSPEFAMKKLLAAGEERLYSLGPVFRDRELTRLHAPAFTMLEWYRAGDGVEAVMADTIDIVRTAAAAAGSTSLRWQDRQADPAADAERLSVLDAFRRLAGVDLHAIGDDAGAFAEAAGERPAPDDTWSDVFSRVLVDCVEPGLGIARPTLLTDYPPSEAALAAISTDADGRELAERFELYACGVELANGFRELTDAAEQRRRFEAAMDRKAAIYGEAYPLDEDFLSALDHMPDASGVALGFDRLVMLATGAPSVHHVQWSPSDLAAGFLG